MIQSVERAVRILQCFENEKVLGITRIAEKMRLSKSTVFGLVTALTELGLLEQDQETSRYRLGLELFRLGSWVDADNRRLLLPELTALSEELEETVNFVRPDGGDVVYLIKKESPHSIRICTKDGWRLPMYCTAVGKAILAHLPAAERDAVVDGFSFTAYTKNTILEKDLLREELRGILERGYAVDREELEEGVVCVAVPLFDTNRVPKAAISCSGPIFRMTPEKIGQCLNALMRSAKKLYGLIT